MIPKLPNPQQVNSFGASSTHEIKAVKRRFATVATSVNIGANDIVTKIDTINGYREIADKVRVFGTPIPEGQGLKNVKGSSLRSVFEDHHLGLKSTGILVIITPDLAILPIIPSIHERAERMGITWAFHGTFTEDTPDVFGFTPSIVKILSEEIPAEVPIGDYSKWLWPWMKKYMQAHRYFDITQSGLCKIVGPKQYPKTPEEKIAEAISDGVVSEPPPSLTLPIKRKKKVVVSKT